MNALFGHTRGSYRHLLILQSLKKPLNDFDAGSIAKILQPYAPKFSLTAEELYTAIVNEDIPWMEEFEQLPLGVYLELLRYLDPNNHNAIKTLHEQYLGVRAGWNDYSVTAEERQAAENYIATSANTPHSPDDPYESIIYTAVLGLGSAHAGIVVECFVKAAQTVVPRDIKPEAFVLCYFEGHVWGNYQQMLELATILLTQKLVALSFESKGNSWKDLALEERLKRVKAEGALLADFTPIEKHAMHWRDLQMPKISIGSLSVHGHQLLQLTVTELELALIINKEEAARGFEVSEYAIPAIERALAIKKGKENAKKGTA